MLNIERTHAVNAEIAQKTRNKLKLININTLYIKINLFGQVKWYYMVLYIKQLNLRLIRLLATRYYI